VIFKLDLCHNESFDLERQKNVLGSALYAYVWVLELDFMRLEHQFSVRR